MDVDSVSRCVVGDLDGARVFTGFDAVSVVSMVGLLVKLFGTYFVGIKVGSDVADDGALVVALILGSGIDAVGVSVENIGDGADVGGDIVGPFVGILLGDSVGSVVG